jgi:microcystin-dependent protein
MPNLLNPDMTVSAFNEQQTPIGSIVVYTGSTNPPKGWLWCNGSTYSQVTYAALFAVLGTHFGSGGAGTFNVPTISDLGGNARLRYMIKALRYDP